VTKTKVLIVEDEAIVAADLANKLEHLGYRVSGTVPSGEDAIAIAGKQRPDIVLMDIRLSGSLDGIETAERMRRAHGIPVVYGTAHSDPDTLTKALGTEPFGYILKPFIDRELKTQIEIALYKHRSEVALRQRQEELERLNEELKDVNRGVVGLYAELNEKARELRRADELKTRFLSNLSHEFRTPLNSIFALSSLLLERTDGELTSEQEKQVGFIRKAADSLLELVNDLLDLSKIRAGRIEVRPVEFSAATLFSALRGMLRSLQLNPAVALVFEEPEGMPWLYTDEGKVSQILRNFISNALKFTERGEVRVSACHDEHSGTVTFTVIDSGIGIAADDQERIFEEFTQLEHPAQSKFKGTGLGLPLCRKLAELLGGRIELESKLGVGSKFSLTLPERYQADNEASVDSSPLSSPSACAEESLPRTRSGDESGGA
jgi:signal transduction histidine kinase